MQRYRMIVCVNDILVTIKKWVVPCGRMAGATSVEQMWTTFNCITGTNILFHGINFPGKQFSTFLHSPIHTIRLDRGWDSLLISFKILNYQLTQNIQTFTFWKYAKFLTLPIWLNYKEAIKYMCIPGPMLYALHILNPSALNSKLLREEMFGIGLKFVLSASMIGVTTFTRYFPLCCVSIAYNYKFMIFLLLICTCSVSDRHTEHIKCTWGINVYKCVKKVWQIDCLIKTV